MRFFLSSILACLAGLAVAQISVRPQAGFNTASFRDTDRNSYFETQVGSQFGLDVQFGRTFYVQPGIMWESVENEIYQEIDNRDNTISINRIRIPLMIGYKLAGHHTDGWLNARAFTGPNMSFVVSKDLGEDPLIDRDDYKGSQWGWNFGFGLDLAFFFVDVGYQFGLSEILDGFDDGPNNNLFYGNFGLRIGF